jgi:hypothetical protein
VFHATGLERDRLEFLAIVCATSEMGQKAKYSPGVDVFCCSPNNGHSAVHLPISWEVIPEFWGGDMLSYSGVLLSGVGAFVGLWLGSRASR